MVSSNSFKGSPMAKKMSGLKLIVERRPDPCHGFTLSVTGFSGVPEQTLCVVNGNFVEHRGAVVLLDIDQHVVYGLSHPGVISRIHSLPPQMLLTTRDLAHKLFEHGMKASLGKVKIKNHWFIASIESFYQVLPSVPSLGLQVISDMTYNRAILEVSIPGCYPVYLATRDYADCRYELRALEDVRSRLEIELESTEK